MTFHVKAFAATLLLSLAAGLPGALAQERRVPSSPNEVRLSYAPVVQLVAPAVVNVYAAKTVSVRNPLFDDHGGSDQLHHGRVGQAHLVRRGRHPALLG